jgi:hypothetical protein
MEENGLLEWYGTDYRGCARRKDMLQKLLCARKRCFPDLLVFEWEILFTIFNEDAINYRIRQYKLSYLVMAQSELLGVLKAATCIEILEKPV